MLPGLGSIFSLYTNTFAAVPTERIPIDTFLKTISGALLLDVRSPGEYNHAHIPGAVSLPLFTDEERAVVGTAYKQQSREQAIKIGLDFFGPKMRHMIEEVVEILNSQQNKNDSAESYETSNRTSKVICMYC